MRLFRRNRLSRGFWMRTLAYGLHRLPYPEDGAVYTWDEELQEWTAVENETQ
jgi:hypothetical protein